MSMTGWDVMRAVLDPSLKIGSPARLVLAAIAQHANGQGRCWVRDHVIAAETELKPRTIRAARSMLRDLGLITWRRTGGANAYTVHLAERHVMPDGAACDAGRSGASCLSERHVMPIGAACDAAPRKETSTRRPLQGDPHTPVASPEHPQLTLIECDPGSPDGDVCLDPPETEQDLADLVSSRATPERLAQLWNHYATRWGMSACESIGAKRRRDMARALREVPTLEQWELIIGRIAARPWCRGERGQWRSSMPHLLERKTPGEYLGDGQYAHIEPVARWASRSDQPATPAGPATAPEPTLAELWQSQDAQAVGGKR